jgi:hypothetical protein
MNETEFHGMRSWHADWWRRHLDEAPTVVLRCGRDGREDLVGEIKTDGTETIVLRYSKFGERTVPVYPAVGLTGDSKTLRPLDDGRRIAKRHQAPASVGPLGLMSSVICPRHGVLDISRETVTHLEQFVADTQRGSRRPYLLFRGTLP